MLSNGHFVAGMMMRKPIIANLPLLPFLRFQRALCIVPRGSYPQDRPLPHHDAAPTPARVFYNKENV